MTRGTIRRHGGRLALVLAAGAAAVLAVAVPRAGSLASAPRPIPAGEWHASIQAADPAASVRVVPARGARLARPARAARVGSVRNWLALDNVKEVLYPKPFRLAASGARVDVWMAEDLAFPAGDCRNSDRRGARLRPTRRQLAYLVREFERKIYPRSSVAFSVPRRRDGRRANVDRRVYDPTGRGYRIVVLVNNIRDSNFYDRHNAQNQPYFAGFFSSRLTEFFDRNIVTIDSYDWTHRTRARPPHRPVVGNYCTSAPARPFLYESTLAHEYQHLLEYYEDRNEALWVNEGLADFAQTLAGYGKPTRTVRQVGFDTHAQCFLGWLGVQTRFNPHPRPGGPENSLTLWPDPGKDEILCEYGAATTFVHFLAGRYGNRFVRALHRDDRPGLAGVSGVLRRLRVRTTAQRALEDWAAMAALDAVLERRTPLRGATARRFRTGYLSASINWDSPSAYALPGAPPNGSDYVRLRAADGRYLTAGELASISFAGTPPRGGRFSVQLIAYSQDRRVPAWYATLPLSAASTASVVQPQLRTMLGDRAEVVAAIVTAHDPSETARAYVRYALTVNGVAQPGG